MGKLLILRLTPRLFRRCARGGRRSWRISSRMALCSAALFRGGKAAESGELPAHDPNGVDERESVWILVGSQRSLMHEAADGEVRHQQAVDFLSHQVGRLAPKDDPGAPKMGLKLAQDRLDFPS